MIMSAAQMQVLAAPANFTARIPFVHVRDVCSAALHLATAEAGRGEVFNLNDDTQMSTLDFLRFMAELSGRPFLKLPPVPLPLIKRMLTPLAQLLVRAYRRRGAGSAPLEPDLLAYLGVDFAYSNEKLKSTGYTFVYPDARDGLREAVAWYKEQRWIA